jgi:hypothetical protein
MSEDKPNLKELLIYITQIEDKRQISQIYVSLEEYARNDGDIQVVLVEEFKETMKKLK